LCINVECDTVAGMLTQTVAPDQTSGQRRTAAARASRRRAAEERWAQTLRERGWTCTPPKTDDDTEE